MLNHTYTSVNNANLVDCGKKQHIPSQPSPLLRDNFLGEFRTELDKKKVLVNLGIATDLSLEWEFIKGDIGRNVDLMKELDSRTKYISEIDGIQKSIIEGIKYIETFVKRDQSDESTQNLRLSTLENTAIELDASLQDLKNYLENSIQININTLEASISDITQKIENITTLIQVSSKAGNALRLLGEDEIDEGETGGLYVPDLSNRVVEAETEIDNIQTNVTNIHDELKTFVKREEFGDGDLRFVAQSDFDAFSTTTSSRLDNLGQELDKTVKTGEDGHVDTLFVNTISKDNTEGSIKLTDSFEVTSDIPLDIRLVKDTLKDLYSIPYSVCYPGMGVIVTSLNALYILKKPAEGITITQEYVSNPNNWKCPEDLVTVALTRQEFESLEEINPSVFYYVYEEEISRTQEPKRDEYLTEEEFRVEWQKWVDSLKTLSQEYMSASWGVDIENKLGKKASSQSVSILQAEINNIKGNGNNPSLESLNNSIVALQETDKTVEERLDEILIKYGDAEKGRLVDLESNIAEVKTDLSQYVTKDYIQDSNNSFIFVKTSDYEADQTELRSELEKQITSEEVRADHLLINETPLTIREGQMYVGDLEIASVEDVPLLEVLPQSEYDEKDKNGELDEGTYYYTFDGDVRLVTSEDLNRTSNKLQQQINVLFKGGTAEDIEGTLETIFLPIETWNTFYQNYQQLFAQVQDLEQRLIKLEPIKFEFADDVLYVSGDPERCYQLDDTVYIKSDLITMA